MRRVFSGVGIVRWRFAYDVVEARAASSLLELSGIGGLAYHGIPTSVNDATAALRLR